MSLKVVLTTLVFFLVSDISFSQKPEVSEEIRFVSYLIDNSEYRDALFLAERALLAGLTDNEHQRDSLNYLAGWAYYSMKNLDSSAYYLGRVGKNSAYYFKSVFYQAFCYIYSGRYDFATVVLSNPELFADSNHLKLRTFELAGMAILQEDHALFQELSSGFDSLYYPSSAEQEKFKDYSKNLSSTKNRSAFLAGLFSAILPGSGKFYAGYRGQAIAGFLPVALLGAVAAESYFKAGLLSPQFLVFGGMFSVFYFGNIWGSALSVKTKKRELYDETKQNVLLDLHLPLRRVFN